jgi:hypothetical protein
LANIDEDFAIFHVAILLSSDNITSNATLSEETGDFMN